MDDQTDRVNTMLLQGVVARGAVHDAQHGVLHQRVVDCLQVGRLDPGGRQGRTVGQAPYPVAVGEALPVPVCQLQMLQLLLDQGKLPVQRFACLLRQERAQFLSCETGNQGIGRRQGPEQQDPAAGGRKPFPGPPVVCCLATGDVQSHAAPVTEFVCKLLHVPFKGTAVHTELRADMRHDLFDGHAALRSAGSQPGQDVDNGKPSCQLAFRGISWHVNTDLYCRHFASL